MQAPTLTTFRNKTNGDPRKRQDRRYFFDKRRFGEGAGMAHDRTQDELIGLLTDVTEQNVRHRRSFVSASLHRAGACLASFVDKHNQNERFWRRPLRNN
jgi:hypothetical protein